MDQYVTTAFGASRDGRERTGEARPSARLTRIPLLIRVSTSDWKTDAPDFEERFRVDTFVGCSATQRTLEKLEQDPCVLAIEASRPSANGGDCARSVPFVKALAVHNSLTSELGNQCLIGIIDTGIDVLHEAFLDNHGRTRIVKIWDQHEHALPSQSHLKFGREYDHSEIQEMVRRNRTVPNRLNHVSKHGTHVASIAGGRACGGFAGGVAPEARLVVVIPKIEVDVTDPTSIGYSLSHVAALDYIRRLAADLDLPAVVNISQGMNAGAHDGKSLLEAAFDTASDGGRAPGFVIVKSAGNEREWKGHARVAIRQNSLETISWQAKKSVRHEDVLELWGSSAADLTFRIIDPKGQPTDWVDKSVPNRTVNLPSGNQVTIALTRYHRDNGDTQLLIRVRPGGQSGIMEGIWRLEVGVGTVRTACILDAWIERENTRSIEFLDHACEDITLSIPGTAITVVCVGALSARSASKTFVPRYSSYGPTRDGRLKPEISAPGDGIIAASAGSGSGVEAMDGTSMAAPHVTGGIALLFSAWEKKRGTRPRLNANQVRSALIQSSQDFNGNWVNGGGYGPLNIEALLAIFLH